MRKETKIIFGIVVLAALVRLVFFFFHQPVWWDSASLIGYGKWIFSSGNIGFEEFTRPFGWPLILGLLWKIGLDPVLFGRILTSLAAIGLVYVTYLLGREADEEKTGLWAAAVLAVMPLLLVHSFRTYTGIISTLIAALAVLFIVKHGILFPAGLLLGIAFLFRYPQGLVLGAVVGFLLLEYLITKEKEWFRRMLDVVFGFGIGFIILLVHDIWRFKIPLYSLTTAVDIIKKSGWIFFHPFWWYILVFFQEQVLLFLAFPALVYTFKKRNLRLLSLIFLTGLVYFSAIQHKESRFIILFLPYAAVLTGAMIKNIVNFFSFRKIVTGVFVVVLVAQAGYGTFMFAQGLKDPNFIETEFYDYLTGKEARTVAISDPRVALALDTKYHLLYYPVFGTALAQEQEQYIQEARDLDYVFFDTCQGGTLCPPDDTTCPVAKANLLVTLDATFERVYYKNTGNCEYYIFTS